MSSFTPNTGEYEILPNIKTLSDEVAFWKKYAQSLPGKTAQMANSFGNILDKIAQQYSNLNQISNSVSAAALSLTQTQNNAAPVISIDKMPTEDDVLRLIEDTQDTLIELWSTNYPLIPNISVGTGNSGKYMMNLSHDRQLESILTIITNDIICYVKASMRAAGLWYKNDFALFRDTVNSSIIILNNAISMVRVLFIGDLLSVYRIPHISVHFLYITVR